MSRLALVTGAAQGIGAAVARKLAADGCRVLAADLNLEGAQQVAASIGGEALPVDMGDPSDVQRMCAGLPDEISILVNVAGVCTTQPIGDITPEAWNKTFAVNVLGTFLLSEHLAKNMAAGSSIVNLASVSGFLGKLEQVDYGASKAAVVSLTRSMALIYGCKGIRVNAVAPGVIDTPLTHSIAEQRAHIRGVRPSETLEPVLKATPLGRVGTAEEVAEAVAFLASDRASFITGQTLCVCGGFLMR